MTRQRLRVGTGPDADHSTLEAALAAAPSGAVIAVGPGRYRESLVVTRVVTILAADGPGTVEIAAAEGSAFLLAAEAVMLSGLTVTGEDADTPAVDVAVGQAAIDDCRITGASWTAVLCRDEGTLAMRGCRISNPSGAGVVVTAPGESVVEDCVVEGLGTSAVVIGGHGDPLVRRCVLRDARGNGLCANGHGRGTVEDCEITGTAKPAIALEEDSSTTVRRTIVRECADAGVHLATRGRARLEGIRVAGASAPGIRLAGGTDPLLVDCEVSGTSDTGIEVTSRSRGRFERCRVADAGAGVVVTEAASPVFSDLTVDGGRATGSCCPGRVPPSSTCSASPARPGPACS